MPVKTTRKHTCARCGKHAESTEMIFSSWTRKRYCRDVNACTNRVARRSGRNPK